MSIFDNFEISAASHKVKNQWGKQLRKVLEKDAVYYLLFLCILQAILLNISKEACSDIWYPCCDVSQILVHSFRSNKHG